MTLSELDVELDRLLAERKHVGASIGKLPRWLARMYRRSVESPQRHDTRLSLTIYLFGLGALLSMAGKGIGGVEDPLSQLGQAHRIDSDLEDLMDELRRRRDAQPG